MEETNACIVTVRNTKIFGKWLKYNPEKESYLVEIKKSKIQQWIGNQYIVTRNELPKKKGV